MPRLPTSLSRHQRGEIKTGIGRADPLFGRGNPRNSIDGCLSIALKVLLISFVFWSILLTLPRNEGPRVYLHPQMPMFGGRFRFEKTHRELSYIAQQLRRSNERMTVEKSSDYRLPHGF